MTDTNDPDIDEKTLDVIIGAYFPRYLGEPDSARTRAQTAYTIASATATALVAAGALGDIQSYPWPVEILGLLSVAGWVFAAYLFMKVTREVTRRRKDTGEAVQGLAPGDFAGRVLARVRADIREIDDRLADALWATAAALILTVLTFAAVLVFPAQPETQATLVLTEEGDVAVDELCSVTVSQLSGELRVDTLDDKYVVMEVPAGMCQPNQRVEVRIPPAQVEAVVSEKRGVIPFAD